MILKTILVVSIVFFTTYIIVVLIDKLLYCIYEFKNDLEGVDKKFNSHPFDLIYLKSSQYKIILKILLASISWGLFYYFNN